MLTKCCIFAIKNGIVTFCQSCLLVRFLVNTATYWENCGFLSFSVIVTLVDSRDGLVEPLLWSFVIAPLLSYSLNFCKGTITVIVWKKNSEYRCNAVFAVWVTSVFCKKCPKSNWIYCFKFWISVNLNVIKNDFCYCEKLFLSFVFFQGFLCVSVTK